MFHSAEGQAGVPVLFLHGAGCDSADWGEVLRRLPDGFAGLCMDFRGHGESAVPPAPFTLQHLAGDVVALLDHLALDRVALVGHSLGGIVALHLAACSDRVAGLVLLEGWTTPQAAAETFAGQRAFGTLDPAAVDRIRRKHDRTWARLPPNAAPVLWESVECFDGLAALRAARMPVVQVFGQMGRTDAAERLLSVPENPGVRAVWLPSSGHYLPHERPAEVARICAEAARAWPAIARRSEHMPGETDLGRLLAGMAPRLEPGEFVFCTVPPARLASLPADAVGMVRESEGVTVILPRRAAEGLGFDCAFPSRMITLGVHSSLEAVGFLAAVLDRLAAVGISVNPLAGCHHDHLFVPADSAEAAMAALRALAAERR